MVQSPIRNAGVYELPKANSATPSSDTPSAARSAQPHTGHGRVSKTQTQTNKNTDTEYVLDMYTSQLYRKKWKHYFFMTTLPSSEMENELLVPLNEGKLTLNFGKARTEKVLAQILPSNVTNWHLITNNARFLISWPQCRGPPICVCVCIYTVIIHII